MSDDPSKAPRQRRGSANASQGLAPRISASARSCAARGWRSAPPSSSTPSRRSASSPGPSPRDFRETLAATIAKSQEDRRVFELLFDRYFFRAAEAEALEQRDPRGPPLRGRRAARPRPAARGDPPGDRRGLRRRDARRSPGSRSPPSGARARARAWSASTSSGSAARSACRPAVATPKATEPRARPRRHPGRSSATCAASSSAALIERTEKMPPSRPLAELDRALPTSPTQDLAAVHRAVAQLKRRLATLGHEQRGRKRGLGRRRAAHDARLAGDRRRAAAPALPAQAPAPPRDLRALRRLDLGHVGAASSSSPSCTPSTTRSASCAASSSSSGSPR